VDQALEAQIAIARCRVDLARVRLALIVDLYHGKGQRMTHGELFQGLVASLRKDVSVAVGKAKALRERGPQSILAFHKAAEALGSVYDEVDAATAEINGALLGDGSNGGGAPTDADEGEIKNSSEGSPPAPESPPPGESRAASFSDVHPSLRRTNYPANA
jgi:hypothetical protein